MNGCSNDMGPIIMAIAGIITIQVPIILSFVFSEIKARRDRRNIKTLVYDNREKLNQVHFMIANGFHGPPGRPGPPGRDAANFDEGSDQ